MASYAILVNGWRGGDEDLLLSILKDAVSVSCEYEESDDAGSCPVTVEWMDDISEALRNYEVSFVGTSLSVAKASVASVSISDSSKKFDRAVVAEPSVVAIDKNGNESNGACNFAWYASDGQGEWTSLESAPSEVGTYKVMTSVVERTNHLAGTGELEFSIARADAKALTVSWMNFSKVYDGNAVEIRAIDVGEYDGEVVLSWYESDGDGG